MRRGLTRGRLKLVTDVARARAEQNRTRPELGDVQGFGGTHARSSAITTTRLPWSAAPPHHTVHVLYMYLLSDLTSYRSPIISWCADLISYGSFPGLRTMGRYKAVS